jgi:CoA:oxalate CoA-transferase
MSVKGPLAGVTIIDLSRILAGPFCTMLLSELGARVIKVETPGTGDDARHFGPFLDGHSAYFSSINRGKESIALDLKNATDRSVLDALLERGDVLVENFRPGTLERLGYGWESLQGKHPRLIYAAASGFGHTGPDAARPAYDMVVQGLSGMMSINGHSAANPARVGVSIGDLGAGLYTAVAINAALYHRAQTGEATKIDISMFDCQLSLLENAIVRYQATGEVPGPLGARHPSITPFEPYETADGLLIIAGGNDSLFRRICTTLELPDLPNDERFSTNANRSRHHEALKVIFDSRLSQHPRAHWIAVMDEAGIPCGPINTIDQALAHPQVAARNMLVSDETGLKLAGNPLKLSGFEDPPTRRAAPALDADRDSILRELGLATDR